MREIVGRLLVATLLLVAAAPLQSAEFLEFYKLGLDALEAGEWEKAADLLQTAIDRQPKSKARVTKAFYFRRYLPHFYLGQALYRAGDCGAAQHAWRESESQGVVTRFPEFQLLKAGSEACRRQQEELELARQQTREVLAAAAAAADSARSELAELRRLDASAAEQLQPRVDEIEQLLEAAGSDFQRAGEAGQLKNATAQAAAAGDALATVAGEAAQRRATLLALQRQLEAERQAALGRAREMLERSEFLRPFPAEVAGRRSEVIELLAQSERADPHPSASLIAELKLAVERLQGAIAAPPAPLRAAAESFLAGDYRSALDALEGEEFASRRAAAHAHLLRAAALFGLFHVGGRDRLELLEQARQQVLSCRQLDPSRVPPSSLFSPRFVRFFEQQQPEIEAPLALGPDVESPEPSAAES